MKNIPEWARDPVVEIIDGDSDGFFLVPIKSTDIGRAFATYIAEHDQPSVDPDIVIAKKWAGKWRGDNNMILEDAILAAIKAAKA